MTIGNGVTSDTFLNIAQGNIPGKRPISALGLYVGTGAVTNAKVIGTGVLNLLPTIGAQLAISSTSANDTSLGTGAKTIEIHYLNNLLEEQEETIIMNGTTPVLTVGTNIRFIQTIHIKTVGTLLSTGGTISAKNIAGTITYDQIIATARRSTSSFRMVPKGKRLILLKGSFGSSSGAATTTAEIKMSSTYFAGHDFSQQEMFVPLGAIALQDSTFGQTFDLPPVFPEGSIVGVEVSTDKAATILGTWFGYLEDVE